MGVFKDIIATIGVITNIVLAIGILNVSVLNYRLFLIANQEQISKHHGIKNFSAEIAFKEKKPVWESTPLRNKAGYVYKIRNKVVSFKKEPCFIIFLKNEGMTPQVIYADIFFKNEKEYIFLDPTDKIWVTYKPREIKPLVLDKDDIQDLREAEGLFITDTGVGYKHQIISKEEINRVLKEYEEYTKKNK